jgi:hypothetical protein
MEKFIFIVLAKIKYLKQPNQLYKYNRNMFSAFYLPLITPGNKIITNFMGKFIVLAKINHLEQPNQQLLELISSINNYKLDFLHILKSPIILKFKFLSCVALSSYAYLVNINMCQYLWHIAVQNERIIK